MKIVFPSFIELTAVAKRRLEALNAEMHEDTPSGETETISRVKDAEIIIGKHLNITSSVIDGAPRLRYIIAPAVGFQSVDYKYAAIKGIPVQNCPGYNAIAVAEHAIELMFAVKRNLLSGAISLQAGEWDPALFKGTEASGKKMGLIGHGHIGKHIGTIATGLGMDVAFINSHSTEQELEKLIHRSDVLCVSLPLISGTDHFLDTRRLCLLQKHAILINVGRGATIDQKALIGLLQSGRIAGAGLDVFEHEPSTKKVSPEIATLVNLKNVVATPHMGYNTEETVERLSEVLLANIDSCLRNNPINVVNSVSK